MVYGRSIAIGVLFLAIVCALSAFIFYLSLGPCPRGTFACDNGELCVLQRQICNHHRDCRDGSDEDPVECGLLYGSREMTNKIVGNAIEKQRRQQLQQQQQQQQHQHENEQIELTNLFNTTASPPTNPTDTFTEITSLVNKTIQIMQDLKFREEQEQQQQQQQLHQLTTPATLSSTLITATLETVTTTTATQINTVNNSAIICEISTYPKQCTCLKKFLLFCNQNAKLNRIPEIGNEVTGLIIIENNLTLNANDLKHFHKLRRLKLKSNNIQQLPLGIFHHLKQLETLDLRYNRISHLPTHIFQGLYKVQWLFLGSNRLETIPVKEMSIHLPQLEWLNLSENLLTLFNMKFPRMLLLYELNLNGNLITHIHPKAFWGLENIRDIRLINNPLKHLSGDTFLNNHYLDALSLGHTFLRIERSFMQWLNISYLNLTGITLEWMTSWYCAAIGVVAVSSSEVSMLILAFMSLERFLLIADPFRGHHRISAKNIFIALLTIWFMGVGLAVAPAVLWQSSTKFYGTYSGTCFPLHIQEAYALGWQYSAFMFLGVNLFLLVMIALLYTALLISIWRTRKATPLSLLDCEFAVHDIYAWLVVFILPLNSAVNPLLYTFTTPKYRNQILSRGWKKITSRRRREPSNGLATTIATATGSSNPERIAYNKNTL
ncbi:hypothetical protein DOY81_005444 [Sarcophaga bullata]|nr:hypothetical protein DOY81_005444 [Sarcophaga bullata]